MVRVAPLGIAPDPHVEARGRDPAGGELEDESALARQRVLDEDLIGSGGGVGPADPDVAAAIDQEAGVAAQLGRDQIGGQPLAGAAAVEAHPRRAVDGPGGVVDLELPPARLRAGLGGPARWRLGEGVGERRARHPGARGGVADGLDLADQGRVDEAAAALGRVKAGPDRGSEQLGGRHPLALVGVQSAQLALGPEARQRRLELDHELLYPLGCRCRRGQSGPRLADQQADMAPHRFETKVVPLPCSRAAGHTGRPKGGQGGGDQPPPGTRAMGRRARSSPGRGRPGGQRGGQQHHPHARRRRGPPRGRRSPASRAGRAAGPRVCDRGRGAPSARTRR